MKAGRVLLLASSIAFLVDALVFCIPYIITGFAMLATPMFLIGLVLIGIIGLYVYAGIVGIRCYKRPQKAKRCIIAGSIALLLGMIVMFSGDGFALIDLPNILLPALYLTGAVMVQRQAAVPG